MRQQKDSRAMAGLPGKRVLVMVGAGVTALVLALVVLLRGGWEEAEVDPRLAMLRSGIVDVVAPSPKDGRLTELVRFYPDGQRVVLERFQTEHFEESGRMPPYRPDYGYTLPAVQIVEASRLKGPEALVICSVLAVFGAALVGAAVFDYRRRDGSRRLRAITDLAADSRAS